MVCASLKSNSCGNGLTNGQPTDADDNADDKIVEQHVPFDPNRYSDGTNGLMYMLPYFFPLGLELMIESIKRRNWNHILVKQSPTS